MPDTATMTDESLHEGHWVAETDSNKVHVLMHRS